MDFKPPKQLVFDHNLHKNYEKFKERFNLYLLAAGLQDKADERKIAMFLHIAGEEAIEVFQTMKMTDEEKKKYVKVIEAFDAYCKPRNNEIYDRYKFFTRSQQEGETSEHFIKELKMLAKPCNFGEQEESLIRDRIVTGLQDLQLQEKLLGMPELKLETAEQLCRVTESSKLQVKGLKGEEVDQVRVTRREKGRKDNDAGKKAEEDYECRKCGGKHKKAQCFAYGKVCYICGRAGHFSIGCFKNKAKTSNNNNNKKNRQFKNNKGRNVNEVDIKEDLFIDNLKLIDNIKYNKDVEAWKENIIIGNESIEFKLDSGAQCNVLPFNYVKKLKKVHEIEKTDQTIVAYGENKIKLVGKIVLRCIVKGKACNISFVVADVNSKPILGLSTCVYLNLITKTERVDSLSKQMTKGIEFLHNNKTVFEGTGKVPFSYKIELKKDSIPVVSSCRRLPDVVKQKLKITLDNLVNRDIIEKADGPSEWVNSIVCVEKPATGTIRICLDPFHLNKYICTDRHPIPTAEEIGIKLKGKNVYSVLDMKEGFYHISLDRESSKLCTFITPYGKYRFKRLPFGLSCSPEVFQRINEQIFGDLGVQIYFDDIIVAGKDEQEHDMLMKRVIKRAKQYNVKFNPSKLQYKVKEVRYLGQIYSGEGVKPDSEYVKAILALETPNNKKELLRLLGMANYLIKYIPRLSEIVSPLRCLIKNNVEFLWTSEHTKAFNKLKVVISNLPTLKIFDPKLPVVIQCDASQSGLGGCLLQLGQPIAFCSRSLSDSETRYAQIEKEYLAICFSLNKFHQFIYGKSIVVESDHKPLIGVQEKDISKISSRLQRMKLKILKYKFKIKYIPGSKMYISDLLSRSYIKDKVNDDPDLKEIVHCIEAEIPISVNRMEDIREKTERDMNLKLVKKFCSEGWPNKKQLSDGEIKMYYKICNDLVVKNGIVFFGERICVPKTLRLYMLQQLHKSHFGMEKTKRRARKLFYWPGMTTEIENFIAKCRVCEKFSRNNVKEPLIPHVVPKLPFEVVGSDILDYGNKSYLVVVDYYSNWLELLKLKNKSIDEVIKQLKVVFASQGLPSKFVSDNVPYNSYKFKKFCQKYGIQCVFSSPRYPKSNGLAEKAVGISKQILRKCQNEDDLFYHLLDYRVTPLCGLDVSPAELLNSRLLRTNIPSSVELLKPKVVDITSKKVNKQEIIKQTYDKTAKGRSEFRENENVVVKLREKGTWRPGIVVSKCATPRSYIVQDDTGAQYRRNSVFIKHSNNTMNDVGKDLVESREEEVEQTESNNNNSQVQSEPSDSNISVTRSGRAVVKPLRYNDYVL